MAGAVHDPPVSVREKNERVVVVFNVSNAKTGSVRTEIQPGETASDPGVLFVAFSSVSPSRRYEKRLQLPHRVLPNRIVSDIQSKCITLQIVKEESSISWGSTWFKETKGAKSKAKKSSAPRGGSDQAASMSPQNSATPPPPEAVADLEAVELGSTEAKQPADVCTNGMPDAQESVATEEAGEDCEQQVHPEPAEPGHLRHDGSIQVVDSAAEGALDNTASTSTATESAAADQKTPENIARLPPKLRERLLQRGILKESEAAAATALESVEPVQQSPAPEVSVTGGSEDSSVANSSAAAKKKKKKKSQKQAAAEIVENDSPAEIDSAIVTASSSTSSAKLASAPAAASAATVSALAAVDQPEARAVRKKTSQSSRQKQQEAKVLATNLSPAAPTLGASAADREGALPVLPPNDPEVTRLVQEALAIFAKDRKKATVLLRLASRKGYLTAYVVLAQKAVEVGDEALMVEALCSLLHNGEAKKQLLPELLGKCALQLAAALRDPQHAEEARKRRSELQVIAKDWPIVLAALDAHELRSPLVNKLSESASNNTVVQTQSKPASQARGKPATTVEPVLAATARDSSKDNGATWDFVLEAALRAFASAGTPPVSPSSSHCASTSCAGLSEQPSAPVEDGFDALD